MRLLIAYAVLTTFIATASASVEHNRPRFQATAGGGAVFADNEPAKTDKKTPNRTIDKNRELARECERLASNGVRLPDKCRHR